MLIRDNLNIVFKVSGLVSGNNDTSLSFKKWVLPALGANIKDNRDIFTTQYGSAAEPYCVVKMPLIAASPNSHRYKAKDQALRLYTA